MKAIDFEFDNKRLSSFGFIICQFGSGGLNTVNDGATINFNTVPVLNGSLNRLISSSYEECLSTTIQICKSSCDTDVQEITSTEHRQLTRWLLRKDFYKLKILDEDNIDLYHEATITSISRIEMNGRLYGLELTIQTNRPFALKEPRTITIKNTEYDGKYSINDTSYEEGYIYPFTEIIIDEDGDLDIYNAIENRHTIIRNCVSGEVITMDYPVIQSSVLSHKIQNDFENWNFFRIANTFDNSRNDLIISIPCTIKIEYSPIVKVGL